MTAERPPPTAPARNRRAHVRKLASSERPTGRRRAAAAAAAAAETATGGPIRHYHCANRRPPSAAVLPWLCVAGPHVHMHKRGSFFARREAWRSPWR